MRLLFVVQRYGTEVAAGAEMLCREYATRLAARGHDVDVLTSCALDYVTWADHYPPGTRTLDGVTVHRLPVVAPRDDEYFGRLNVRVPWGTKPVPLHLQERWIRAAGPELDGLVPWLAEHAGGYDLAVFFTYLYWTTWAGLPVAAGLVPTVLHPTAHDEPPLYLSLFDTTFRHPTAFGFLTEEEEALVRRRFGINRPSTVVGVGVDLDAGAGADGSQFREASGIGDRPYLLCVGRIDTAKGSEELFDFFTTYKARNPGPLALALVGDPARPLPEHPDVFVTGVVPDAVKHSALAGCMALVQPSFFESFSIVLAEAGAAGKPVLAQGYCDVLAGAVRRSGGGLLYRGYAEFESALDAYMSNTALAAGMGTSGRAYVSRTGRWDRIMTHYEEGLRRTVGRSARLASALGARDRNRSPTQGQHIMLRRSPVQREP